MRSLKQFLDEHFEDNYAGQLDQAIALARALFETLSKLGRNDGMRDLSGQAFEMIKRLIDEMHDQFGSR